MNMGGSRQELLIYDLPQLRNSFHVFRDRADAGMHLANMLEGCRGSGALVMAVPAGGVPVGVTVARELELALDLAVVSKITLPWSTESGYGAVAFDGTVMLNEKLLPDLGLSDDQIQEGITRTREKVRRRSRELRGDQPIPELSGRTVILVDDGLASGFTMKVAVQALRNQRCREILAATPTAHEQAAASVAQVAEAVYCPNLRHGWQFAVADAYEEWYDVSEDEVRALLAEFETFRSSANR